MNPVSTGRRDDPACRSGNHRIRMSRCSGVSNTSPPAGSRFLLAALLGAGLLLAVPGPCSLAAPVPRATRVIRLPGGGSIEVVTRYHDANYRAGQMIDVDPVDDVLSDTGDFPVSITDGYVELRRGGFAPCVQRARATPDSPDCVDGTPPVLSDRGSPASFSFAFNRLFRMDAAGAATQELGPAGRSYGFASFRVTLELVAKDGSTRVESFPVTVTVEDRGFPDGPDPLVPPPAVMPAGGLAEPLAPGPRALQ